MNDVTYSHMTAAQLRTLADSMGAADVVTVSMSRRMDSKYTDHQMREAAKSGLRLSRTR